MYLPVALLIIKPHEFAYRQHLVIHRPNHKGCSAISDKIDPSFADRF